ncbi:S-layer homology domain-containing protein [Jeotgalibacillus aurantiacus]|uniref:S-layer homology domain-containing protein n=1 Tax=Jeotgalibacillus aurantiacus TaxID=2763266 RepID=UPI001D0A0F99|nr:S-layer homology domain-containing protein [Jeotgalibacillus aurantiacus]
MVKIYAGMKLLVVMCLMFSLIGINSAAAEDDISGHGLEKEMRAIIDLGIMKGYGDGVFNPQANVTRSQFATLLTRALNLEPDVTITFSDMPDDQGLAEGIQGAAAAGIVTGYDNDSFKPYDKISRVHMSVMLKRALDYLQIESKRATLRYVDNSQIARQYEEHVSVVTFYEIMGGRTIDNKTYFAPKEFSTRAQAAAVLYRLLNLITDVEDPTPVDPVEPDVGFGIASYQNGELFIEKEYSSYETALQAWQNSSGKLLTYGDSIIKMNTGIALTVPTKAGSLTNVYNESMSSAWTYVVNDTELRYLDSDDTKVKVQVGNKVGYVKHENVKLFPFSALKDRSSYSVNSSGELVHKVYQNSRDAAASYVVGPAPSELQQGQVYFSWDGSTFFNAAGSQVAEGFQYFQHLPARSETSYTADEINQYILNELVALEQRNPNSTLYKDASKRSKLIGIGSHLKKVEAEKGVNALMILALAQHESAYGLSDRAQTYNNLFGLRVYDDNPANDYFKTVAENVDELLNEFWNKNYIPPTGIHANGAAFGHKGYGFNVKYASDPYWGSKAAGHMYRIDKALGGRDLQNAVQIGITTTDGLNVRKAPDLTETSKLFTYPKTNMPVILKGEVSGASDIPWIKITSDLGIKQEAYVSGHYIRTLPIVK